MNPVRIMMVLLPFAWQKLERSSKAHRTQKGKLNRVLLGVNPCTAFGT